jgi:hypothetical protein
LQKKNLQKQIKVVVVEEENRQKDDSPRHVQEVVDIVVVRPTSAVVKNNEIPETHMHWQFSQIQLQ